MGEASALNRRSSGRSIMEHLRLQVDLLEELVAELEELNSVHELAEGRTYLVVVPHGWGKSRDAAVAFAVAVKNGAYFPDNAEAVVYDAPESAYIDQLGRSLMDEGDEPSVEVKRLPLDEDRRYAWSSFTESLPMVAWRALHNRKD